MNTEPMARLLARRLEDRGEKAGARISVEDLVERDVPYRVARSSLELTTKAEYDLLVLEFLADPRLVAHDDPAVAEVAAGELDTPEPGLDALAEHADATLRLDLATISGGYRRSGPGDSGGGPEPGTEGAGDPSAAAGEGGTAEEPGEGDAAWDPTGGVRARPAAEGGGSEAHTGADTGDGAEVDAEHGADDEAEGASAIGAGRDDVAGSDAPDSSPAEGDCRSCGEPLPLDADLPVRFCPHCGAARPERACPRCGTRLRPEWSYCPACGTRASPSAEVDGGSGSGGAADVDVSEWEPE